MFRFIYHISDIHIRLYHRLEEYQEVFDNLYAFLEKEKREGKNGLVVITGDLLHHKNELSPECIVFTRAFLKRLGSIFTTILIAGNHDALLNNQNRMDSLSAVLEAPCDNVHYYKTSGFYEIENVVFGVSSLLDKTLLDYKSFKDKTTIALFHGGVGKYSTNKGFWMEGIPVSTFEGYDLVLLGDIHLHQYLDTKKRIAYSGSLISQNFTETDPNHGVLIWDLQDLSSRLVRIPNPFAYCEGMLEYPYLHFQGTRLKLDQLPMYLPSKGRLQIVLSRRKHAEDICWVQDLQHMCPGVTVQERPVLDQKPDSTKMVSSSKETQKDLLESYLESLPEDWTDKEELLIALMKTLSWETRGKTGVRWELIEMEFHDMFGYGGNNKIQFDKLPLHETIGIFGENSAGKSTLIDLLLFLLYGHITRYSHGVSVPKEVIRFGKTKSWGKITFAVHGIKYMIEKKMTLQKNGKIRVDEKLWKMQDGIIMDLSEEHRKKTDKFVISQIGTWEQFLFTTVFLQQNEKSFRSMSPKDRKEFLFEILDLQRLETLEEEKKDELRQKKRRLDLLEKEIKLRPLENLKKEQSTLTERIEELKEKESETQILLQTTRSFLEDAYSQRRPLTHPDPLSKIAIIEKDILKLKKDQEVEEPEKEEKACYEEIQRLLGQKIPLPERPSKQGYYAYNFTDKEAFQEWESKNPVPETILETEELLCQKEEYIQKLQPELSHSYGKKGSKELRERLNHIQPDYEWEELIGIEDQLYKKKANLESKITPLEEKKKEIHIQESCLRARQAQTSTILNGLEFSKRCTFCKKNEQKVSEICLKIQLEECEEKLLEIHRQLDPFQNEYFETETKLKEVMDQKTKWEEVRILHTILSNRSIQKKIKALNETIETVRETKRKEVIRTIWKNTLVWNDAVQQNTKTELAIAKEHQILDHWKAFHQKKTTTERLEQLEKERERLAKEVEDTKFNREIQSRISNLLREQESIQTQLQMFLRERISLEEKYKTIEEHIQKTLEQKTDYDSLLKEIVFLQHLTHVIGRDGFPMFLLETCLPLMEEQLNLLLSPFFPDKKVGLRLERKKDSTNVLLCVKKGGEDTIYLGGMEGFMVDAALKIVFSRMSRIPRPDIFIIDEGISALDKKNMENLDRLFQFLETYFSQVFIISHIKQAQDFVRHAITVVKENGQSRLVF